MAVDLLCYQLDLRIKGKSFNRCSSRHQKYLMRERSNYGSDGESAYVLYHNIVSRAVVQEVMLINSQVSV